MSIVLLTIDFFLVYINKTIKILYIIQYLCSDKNSSKTSLEKQLKYFTYFNIILQVKTAVPFIDPRLQSANLLSNEEFFSTKKKPMRIYAIFRIESKYRQGNMMLKLQNVCLLLFNMFKNILEILCVIEFF